MGFIKGYEMLAHLLLGKLGVESPQKWVNGYIVSLAAASVANRMKFVDEEKNEADVAYDRTLVLFVECDVAAHCFPVAVKSGTYQLAFSVHTWAA
jgi:hypothetical protein